MLAVFVILLSAIASLINLPIGSADFRFSAGILILISALMLNKKLKPEIMGVCTGLAVVLTRVLVASINNVDMDLLSYFLELAFYLGYVYVYRWAVIDDDQIYQMPLVIGLSLADFGGNTLEYFIRLAFKYESWSKASLGTLIIGAFVRSALIILIVFLLHRILRAMGHDIPDPLVEQSPILNPESRPKN